MEKYSQITFLMYNMNMKNMKHEKQLKYTLTILFEIYILRLKQSNPRLYISFLNIISVSVPLNKELSIVQKSDLV